ncbi:tetratricopeptide repeat protein, putative [Plasmodium vinckei brucechwatti]|uniref:peptidylprolyl isomerase n=1 Tax=Plasmodium vinckei brucechwatti TaxID=119398 RepID=A0A6V7SY80_PLAVN|nr:tetratricopeptide repeat protein, putative [Plasmodium vinckei brucechwatti]
MEVISNGTKLKKIDNEPNKYVDKNENLGTNISEKHLPKLSSTQLKKNPSVLAEKKSQKKEYDESEVKGEEKVSILKSTDFSDDEKLSKDDANEKYKSGDYEEALKIWKRGLKSINYVLSKHEELNSEKLYEFKKMHSTYCSNIAQGHLKLNQYSECVKYSLLAKEHDKLNVKIYFRLAKGYFMLGKYDDAIHVLNEGIKINNDTALVNLLQVVKRKKLIYLQKEKNTMKFIFQKLEEKSIIETDKKNGNPFFNNIFSFICLFFMYVYSLFVSLSNYFSHIIKRQKMMKDE